MHQSTEKPNNMVNGFCNPYNALFVSQNSQETNESYNIDSEHVIADEELVKKDMNYQDFITEDLLKQIESSSPIKSDKIAHPKPEHSKFFLQNSGENPSPINANGNIPSFFPKKNNLWKHGNGRMQPYLNPFNHEGQIPIQNERYFPQIIPRTYLTPKNQCMTFSNYNEKGWICCSCKTINSEMRNQCYRCNYLRLIPSLNYSSKNSTVVNNNKIPLMNVQNDQRKNNPVQLPSPSINEGTKINLTLREIAQINQMQYNQLKKINQLKELQASEKQKKYNTPVLTSNLKEKFENSGNGSVNVNKKKKKPFAERAGDWVCVKCKNLNFSFRSACNRCQITKSENDKLYEQYMNNLMNYCKVNDMLQLKYTSQNTSFPQWISPSNIPITQPTDEQNINNSEDKEEYHEISEDQTKSNQNKETDVPINENK